MIREDIWGDLFSGRQLFGDLICTILKLELDDAGTIIANLYMYGGLYENFEENWQHGSQQEIREDTER